MNATHNYFCSKNNQESKPCAYHVGCPRVFACPKENSVSEKLFLDKLLENKATAGVATLNRCDRLKLATARGRLETSQPILTAVLTGKDSTLVS